MSIKALLFAAILASSSGSAFAQAGTMRPETSRTDTMPSAAKRIDMTTGETSSASARPRTTANQLNRANGKYYRMRSRARAQGRMDRRAYQAVVMAQHHRAVNRYDRRYARQQRAYANAMAAWRRQVTACNHGNRRACRAHSPRVADFY